MLKNTNAMKVLQMKISTIEECRQIKFINLSFIKISINDNWPSKFKVSASF